jgi:hypothetical protein
MAYLQTLNPPAQITRNPHTSIYIYLQSRKVVYIHIVRIIFYINHKMLLFSLNVNVIYMTVIYNFFFQNEPPQKDTYLVFRLLTLDCSDTLA